MRQALASRTIIEDGNEAPISPPLSPEEIGDKFPGFEVLECLGRGGMGVVYKARQKSLGRLVAIKILPPERVGEEKFSERFAIEAATLAKLSHPNIVTVHDFGEIDGLFYIVMEYIDGVNLRDLLREGKLEAKQALAIVPPICDALQSAHDRGVVHRDIKPENILLDRDGRVKIADFGIASLMGVTGEIADRDGRVKIADFGIASLMGAAGEIAGTPPYMAPEQKGANIDHRADIYALGVVLYEMLTGERPDKELIAPSRKVQIDVRLDEMVLRALEKEPELRYQTAGEFRTMVETIGSIPPSMPRVEEVVSEDPRGMVRRWWWVFPAMVPVSVMLALMAAAVFNYVIPKKFETEATIEFRSLEGLPQSERSLPTAFDRIKASASLAEVSRRLDLQNRWLLREHEVISALKSLIIVQSIRGTDLVSIRVRHTSPQDAVDVANAVVDVAKADPEARVFLHEMPVLPQSPVSPNLALNLVLAGFVGLFASPVLGLLLAAVLHRVFPEKRGRNLQRGVMAERSLEVSPSPRSERVVRRREEATPPVKTPEEGSSEPGTRRKSRRKKVRFRLHDRTPGKAALLGIAALCLFVGCLLPAIGEPLWRLITSERSISDAVSTASATSDAGWLPVVVLIGFVLLFATMVFSLVLVVRSNGSGATKALAAVLLILLFGGTMAVLGIVGIAVGVSHRFARTHEMPLLMPE
ncbi:unnamed protein product [Oikopleura dioica]|uniref:NEK6-subfamily protein kinase n=1 Tax=Oikopleura dioica TaxID=34765 RepID=E4XU17_OIKDI|nr:unnamed protein product [Oikopleura dioica]